MYNVDMDRVTVDTKSKILALMLLICIILSAYFAYYRTIVLKNYPIIQVEK